VRKRPSMLSPSGIVGVAVAVAVQTLLITPADAAASGTPTARDGAGAQSAIEWFQAHNGDSAYENLCETAVENAWGTSGVWPTAIAHWEGAITAGKAHQGDTNPPVGAFVYWRTSEEGHVGIADGHGDFYSSNVYGRIGHGDSLGFFANYLGWSNPQVPT
jgi:hypothetical protein